VEAPGNVFSSAVLRPPFISSVSLWESSDAAMDYAFSGHQAGHTSGAHATGPRPSGIAHPQVSIVVTSAVPSNAGPERYRVVRGPAHERRNRHSRRCAMELQNGQFALRC
jgi:hypothetical protein